MLEKQPLEIKIPEKAEPHLQIWFLTVSKMSNSLKKIQHEF